MLDEPAGISPFGWAIATGGRGLVQLQDEVRALGTWSAAAWARHFPAEQGYQVDVARSASDAQVLHLTVRRGEFHAEASLEHDLPAGAEGSSRSVRMFGRARFEAVDRARARGQRMIARSRAMGWAGGLAVFLSLAWLMVGVRDPIYVLGGMLLVVALLVTVIAGGSVGAWVGERLAALQHERARRQVEADPATPDDLRRWKAVARQLGAQRAALLSSRRQPFRSEPRAIAG